MSFVSKLWKNRDSEYPTRRILNDLSTTPPTQMLVTVERSEGEVTEAGDTFDANTMNNLEARIASAFTQADAKMGDLADLDTTDKSSLVNAINEAAQGGGGGGSSTLAGLNDVDLTTPANGQVLKYNSTSQKWENANESGGGGSTVHMAIINIETDEMPLDATAYPYTYINTVDENGTTISDADIWTYIDNGYEPVLRITSTFYVTKEVIVPMTSYDKDTKLIRFNPSPYDGTSIYWADYQLIEVGEGVNNTVNVYFSYDKYARLSSPAFTGNPTAPTPSAGDDSTKIATTAFIQDAIEEATQYKVGDTISLLGEIYAGVVSRSSQDVYFFIPLPKGFKNVSSVAISGNWYVRGNGVNIVSNATLASVGTVTETITSNGVQIKVVLNTASTITTNTAITAYGFSNSKLTFS